jgi:hypothetical protein
MWARVAKTLAPPKPDRLWKRPMMMMRRLPHGSGPIQTIPKRQRHHVRYEYETNSPEGKGGTSEFGGPFLEESVQRMKAVIKEVLAHLTTHLYKNGELVSAAIYAAALRRLSPDHKMGEFTRHDMALHQELNRRFGMSPPRYVYQAVDTLVKMVVDKLAEHGIADA